MGWYNDISLIIDTSDILLQLLQRVCWINLDSLNGLCKKINDSEGNRVKMSLNMFDMNCARLVLACAIWDSSLLSIPLLLKILQRIRTSPKRAGKIHFWTILNFGLFINLSVISIRKIKDNKKMRSNYEKMNFSGELYHFPVRMLLESCEKSL